MSSDKAEAYSNKLAIKRDQTTKTVARAKVCFRARQLFAACDRSSTDCLPPFAVVVAGGRGERGGGVGGVYPGLLLLLLREGEREGVGWGDYPGLEKCCVM